MDRMPNRQPATPERRCPDCGKTLSRLNRGPYCFACQPQDAEGAPSRRAAKRAGLPRDEIIVLYKELGDSAAVAERLGLPRSSVWSVIQRAQRDGLLTSKPGNDRS
jgi:hypothetical protein